MTIRMYLTTYDDTRNRCKTHLLCLFYPEQRSTKMAALNKGITNMLKQKVKEGNK